MQLWIGPVEQAFVDKGRKKGRQEGLKEGRGQGMEQGLERGLERGLARGLERGRKEGAVALLGRQLTRRFGPLSKTVRNKLNKASLAQLEAWSDALPEAQTLKQVFQS